MAEFSAKNKGTIYKFWLDALSRSKDKLDISNIEALLRNLDDLSVKKRFYKEGDSVNVYEAKVAMSNMDIGKITSGNNLNISETSDNLTNINAYEANSIDYYNEAKSAVVTASSDLKSHYSDDKLTDKDIAQALFNEYNRDGDLGDYAKSIKKFINNGKLNNDDIIRIDNVLRNQESLTISPERISKFIDAVNKRRASEDTFKIKSEDHLDNYARVSDNEEAIRLQNSMRDKNNRSHKKVTLITDEIALKGFNINHLLHKLSKVKNRSEFNELIENTKYRLYNAKDLTEDDRNYLLTFMDNLGNKLNLHGDKLDDLDEDEFSKAVRSSISSLTGIHSEGANDRYKDSLYHNLDYASIDSMEEALPILRYLDKIGDNYDNMSSDAKSEYNTILSRLKNNKFIKENFKDMLEYKRDSNNLITDIDMDESKFTDEQLKYLTATIEELRVLIEQSQIQYAIDGANKIPNVFVTNNTTNKITSVNEDVTNES